MKVLFLSLLDFDSFSDENIYADILREFIKDGHEVYCISPVERRQNRPTELRRDNGGCLLKLRIGNIQKVNLIEKGISTLLIESLFIQGIKQYFREIRFDLVLYATPPITFASVIRYVKKRDGAASYLMLKDIFPQNAVDLGMLSKKGVKGLLYWYFRGKEKALYALSDHIGCMSQANVEYVLKHNPQIAPDKVGICPNCMEIQDVQLSEEERRQMRIRYEISQDKKVFVYGGNLGRPQDVPFIVKCFRACSKLKDAYFVVAGKGTDRHDLEEYIEREKPSHVKLLEELPKEEYDRMIACCDIGLIFLDHRFTIPNFPSRLLSYMQAGLPVLACTDPCTDIGKEIVSNGFGWWCESNSPETFCDLVSSIAVPDMSKKEQALRCLQEQYASARAYEIICAAIQNSKAGSIG